MQGTGLVAPASKPSVHMASLTRLSVLIAESDAARSREIAAMLRDLDVQHVTEVGDAAQLASALRERAFDVLICAEQLGNDDGSALVRAARKSAPATRSVLTRPSERAAAPIPTDVEVVDVPFTRQSLLSLLQQTASPHGGLWCEVPALSLSDILQMYHQARRSITVLLSGPVAGSVRLDAGEIVDAEMGDERGMAALSRLLEAETGLIRTAPVAPTPQEPTIDAPFERVLLEAAQKLDERRRDMRANQMTNEMTSVSADVLRPSVPLPFQAHAPDPTSFLAPPLPVPRRRWGVAVVGVLLGGALAAGAVVFLQRQGQRAASEALALDVANEVVVEQAAHALKPSPPPVPDEPPAAPVVSEPPAVSPPAGFTLHITSKPSHATVLEAGKVIGKTPLDVPIGSSSVAKAPRRFVVRHAGHVSSRIVQGASASNVNAAVVLQPRAVPNVEQPDGGRIESEATAGDGDTGSRGRRRELNVRTRR